MQLSFLEDTIASTNLICFYKGKRVSSVFDYLKGFRRVLVLTFSFSPVHVLTLFDELGYEEADVVMGLRGSDVEEVLGNFVGELFDIPKLSQEIQELLSVNVRAASKVASGKYKVFTASFPMHAKLAVLYGERGPERIIWGSANFTKQGLGGQQYEILEVVDPEDAPEKFAALEALGNEVLSKAKPRYPDRLIKKCSEAVSSSEAAEKIVVADTVDVVESVIEQADRIRVCAPPEVLQKALNLTVQRVKDERLKLEERKRVVADLVPLVSEQRGKKLIFGSKGEISKKASQIVQVFKGEQQEQEVWRDKRPWWVFREDGTLMCRDTADAVSSLDVDWEDSLRLLVNFVDSYRIGVGAREGFRTASYVMEALLYLLQSPFMWRIRYLVSRYQHIGLEICDIPPFLVIAGESSTGKTYLLRRMAELLGYPDAVYQYSLKSARYSDEAGDREIAYMLASRGVFPVLVDEIQPQYFSSQEAKRSNSGIFFVKALANRIPDTPWDEASCLIATCNFLTFAAPFELVGRRVYYLPLKYRLYRNRVEESGKLVKRLDHSFFTAFAAYMEAFLERVEENEFEAEELVKRMREDFLYPARSIVRGMLERAKIPKPEWYPEQSFSNLYYTEVARTTWIGIVKQHPHLFEKKEVIDGVEYYNVTSVLTGYSKNDIRSLTAKLPSGVLQTSSGVYLLHAGEFEKFVGKHVFEEIRRRNLFGVIKKLTGWS